MKNTFVKSAMSAFLSALMVCFVAGNVSAQKNEEKREELKEARSEAKEAAKVLTEMMKKPDDFIPRELLEKASAIAIFPDVVKAAFIVGGRAGDGVVARRTATGWSVPVYYNIGGASFGAQIGAKRTDHIMLFMNEGSMRDLLDEKVEFGGALSFAAGPVGRTIGAATNPTLDAGILVWSRSAGAFVGAAIKGAVLTADNSKNEAVYGMSAKEILANPATVKTNGLSKEITKFSSTVARYAGKK
ncbi:MAG TPA: lipid-binding SYLF domain-containing protein [Pyrinomonadaceae bacterium]|nr:lipid-binding SYLF domain-containing protein [Pyrinomonadaceae bacterium]